MTLKSKRVISFEASLPIDKETLGPPEVEVSTETHALHIQHVQNDGKSVSHSVISNSLQLHGL